MGYNMTSRNGSFFANMSVSVHVDRDGNFAAIVRYLALLHKESVPDGTVLVIKDDEIVYEEATSFWLTSTTMSCPESMKYFETMVEKYNTYKPTAVAVFTNHIYQFGWVCKHRYCSHKVARVADLVQVSLQQSRRDLDRENLVEKPCPDKLWTESGDHGLLWLLPTCSRNDK